MDLQLRGYVGDEHDGFTDATFEDMYGAAKADEELNVVLNSGGGSVFQGLSVYQTLANHAGRVTIEVQGIAGSIASVIAMAGDTIEMHQSSRFMIHNPMGPSALAFGTSEDLRGAADDTLKTAALLDSIRDDLISIYSARTGASKTDLSKWMDAETFMNAAESLDRGFAESVIENKSMAAACVPRAYAIADTDELQKIKDLCGKLTLRAPRKDDGKGRLRLAKAQFQQMTS